MCSDQIYLFIYLCIYLFIPYLFNHLYLFVGCDDCSSWLGLACIVSFIIITVHSYVAPTLNKLIYLFILSISLQGSDYLLYKYSEVQ